MAALQFQCPSCGEVASFSGTPGEDIIVTCPRCMMKGKIRFPAEDNAQYAIEVSHLKKVYDDLIAVNDISFKVRKGEIFAFLGPNGAGKTTTVEIIESIREPTAGSVKLLGVDTKTGFNSVKEKISILPQEFHSFERFTVRETLEYFSNLYEKRANIDGIIAAMNLQSNEKMLYKNLSGGLKQRVGVAVSLVNDPDIVFLDEPTTGLDPKARREVWQVVANLRAQGKTVFLTTHYMEEAEYLADHIAIIFKGQIIAEGSLDDLIAKFGRGSVLHIQGCSSPETIAILNEQGYDARSEGNGNVAVTIAYKERVLDVLSALRHGAIDYESIEIRRSNLEEVFLSLTGAKLREA
jgi:ABC-2 type transport system ATP-binding protein